MTQRIFIIFVLLAAFSLTSAAQFITGTVVDEETGDGIPYASVVYKGHNIAVVSDDKGQYRIDRHNGWSITFSAVGYKSQVVEIDYDTRGRMDIRLSPDGAQIEEVTVKACRRANGNSSALDQNMESIYPHPGQNSSPPPIRYNSIFRYRAENKDRMGVRHNFLPLQSILLSCIYLTLY